MHSSYVKHPIRCYYIICQTSLASRSRACYLKLHTGVIFCSVYKNKGGMEKWLSWIVQYEMSRHATPRVLHKGTVWQINCWCAKAYFMHKGPFSPFPFGISAPCTAYPDIQKSCILVTIRHKTSVTFATKSSCFSSEKAGDIWFPARCKLGSPE